MNWNSLEDFLHMGGAGLYVWGSYIVCAIAMVAEPLLIAQRHRQARTAASQPLDEEN